MIQITITISSPEVDAKSIETEIRSLLAFKDYTLSIETTEAETEAGVCVSSEEVPGLKS